MNIKTILYFVITPLVLWSLESIDLKTYFKKNRYYQIITVYLFITISLSYLVVNFFYDFFINSKFI
ncbi:MAG: DUF1146 family protein [Bacilli bacterium]